MKYPAIGNVAEDLVKLRSKKILVIDDDEFVGDLIAKVLTRYLDLEVFRAKSGSEGIAAALTGRYDGAIISLALKHTGSWNVIRTIKSMLPEFPFIATAAQASNSVQRQVRQFGITTILYKPFKMTALIEGVTEVFGVERNLAPLA